MKQDRESDVPFRLATVSSLVVVNIEPLPINSYNKTLNTILLFRVDNNFHLLRFPSGLTSSRSFIQYCFAHTFCLRVHLTIRHYLEPESFSWLGRLKPYNVFILACTYKSSTILNIKNNCLEI